MKALRSYPPLSFVALILLFASELGWTSAPQLVKDLNTTAFGTRTELCSEVVEFENSYYFCGNSPVTGEELWKVDGSLENPQQVIDIAPGDANSSPKELIVFNNQLYFAANKKIYKTDGTEQGTSIASSFPETVFFISNLRIHNQMLLVAADTDSASLWASDGNSFEPLSEQIVSSGSGIKNAATIGTKLFFTARTVDTGIELWVTEGTPESTVLVKDINVGPENAEILSIVAADNYVTFSALLRNPATQSNVRNLWASDGTAAGTAQITNLDGLSFSRLCGSRATLGNKTVFCFDGESDTGAELWITDGTLNGTTLLKDINSGQADSSPRNLRSTGSRVVFFADSGTGHDQLWSTDGTESGTQQTSTESIDSEQRELMTNSGDYFFIDKTADTGLGVWRLANNATTAALVTNLDTDPIPTTSSRLKLLGSENGVAYFSARRAFWKTDGTALGTSRIDSFIAPGTFGTGSDSLSEITQFSITNDRAFFLNPDPTIPTILRGWVHEPSSTRVITNQFNQTDLTTESARFGPMIEFNDELYFIAYDGRQHGLWTTKGNNSSTQFIAPLEIQCDSISDIVATNEYIYFICNGESLWRSDGTTDETIKLSSVGQNPRFSIDTAERLTAVGNTVFFIGFNEASGRELWRSNGTSESTVMVKDIKTGAESAFQTEENDNIADLSNMATLNGILYFSADDGIHGPELWQSGGTAETTSMVKDIFELENTGSFPQDITRVGDTLFFSAFTLGLGYELWKSDGSADGTTLVKNIEPSTFTITVFRFTCEIIGFIELCADRAFEVVQPNSSLPIGIVDYNGTAVFRAYTKEHGYELWASDGTSNGTRLIEDLLPGSESGFAIPAPPDDLDFKTNYRLLEQLSNVAIHDNELYFTANTGRGFTELWKTNLSNQQTSLIHETNQTSNVLPIIHSLSETQPTDNLLYFIAPGPNNLQRLWQHTSIDNSTQVVGQFTEFGLIGARILSFDNDRLYVAGITNNKGFELHVITADADRDGIDDPLDNCARDSNPSQENFDSDPQGDACDLDDDNDGVNDAEDAFSLDPSETRDNDQDGTGNNADPDDDNDLVNDRDEFGEPLDNCQFIDNPDQADTNRNGIGDACEISELCVPIITKNAKVTLVCI